MLKQKKEALSFTALMIILTAGAKSSGLGASQVQQPSRVKPSQISIQKYSSGRVGSITPPSPGMGYMTPSSPGLGYMTPSSPGMGHMTPPSPGMGHMIPSSPRMGHMIPSSPGMENQFFPLGMGNMPQFSSNGIRGMPPYTLGMGSMQSGMGFSRMQPGMGPSSMQPGMGSMYHLGLGATQHLPLASNNPHGIGMGVRGMQ